MRNDFDDDVSTTNDALSVVCGWSVFFYALLLLFLSLSFVCVCVCMCVYVCIYITTIRVPSFPLRSFPKGSRVQPKCGVKDTTKISNTSIGTLVCVCFSRLISLVWCCYFFVVAFFLWLFGRFFFPKSCRNVVKVSFSFSRVLSWFF